MIYSRAHSTRQQLFSHAEGRRAKLATGWRPRALQTLKTSILVIKAEAPAGLFSPGQGDLQAKERN